MTTYTVKGEAFASHIFAADQMEAEALAAKRGLGEVIRGVDTTGKLPQIPEDPADRAHLACFLSFVALRSGTADSEKLLGDRGILHEMIHALCGASDVDATTIERGLKWLCRVTPGYEPV